MVRRRVCLLLVVAGLVAACGGGDDPTRTQSADDGMRVASFDFAESVLLAEMYAQVIESTGTPVVRVGAVGPREIIAPALELGHIDVVPEYLGTLLQYVGAPDSDPDTDSALRELDTRLAERGLRALDAAPAQDKNVFVVTDELASTEALVDLSDLVDLAPELRFGGPPECQERRLCLVGLEEVYGLRFAEFVPQRSLRFTEEALDRNEIDVGVMFSTAATLLTSDLVELVDDRQLQPAENVVPVMRIDAVERWGPDVVAALDAMSAELTTSELRSLNLQVAIEESIEAVVRRWLLAKGLVDGG